MSKSLVIFILSLTSFNCYAFMDFISKKSEDLAKSSLYADAVADLLTEVAPDTDLQSVAQENQVRTSKMTNDAQNLSYLSDDTKGILEGPNLGHESLDENIRASSSYIRKIKNVVAKLAVLGTDGFTALNTLQTNQTLEQIRKNQAIEIALAQQYNQRKATKESIEDSKMREFILQQRAIRKASFSTARQ
ncbi:MAG: hypothetical protein ACXVCP_08480 [Bdellovibrio sp.]